MKHPVSTPKLFVACVLLFGTLAIPADARTRPDISPAISLHEENHWQLPVLATLLGATLVASVGLYDDDNLVVTNGDLSSQDYWWTKFDAMMLEIALKQHQPEGRIGINIAIALRRMDDLIKKYPKHEGIKKWKARFEEVQSKINPDADRRANFTVECPWDESNFAQLWVNFHFTKLLVEQKNWNDAAPLIQNVKQNYKIMLAPDRMKNYPEDLRKWVIESQPEADKLAATIKAKTGG